MIFENRTQAGKALAARLTDYRNHKEAIVIGLPRGGVVLAYEVAKTLNLPLDIMSPRKIGAPHNPELAIGAITETGEGFFNQEILSYLQVSQDYIDLTVEREKKKAEQRLRLYRKNKPPRNLENKIVIIVDDGLATGATMRAAIKTTKAEGASKIIAAIPVSPADTYEKIKEEVDEVVCLSIPPFFEAVGQFYRSFDQTEDEEVIDLLTKFNEEK